MTAGAKSRDGTLPEVPEMPYLPEPAIPQLSQVEKTVAAQFAGFQELGWRRRSKEEKAFHSLVTPVFLLHILCYILHHIIRRLY